MKLFMITKNEVTFSQNLEFEKSGEILILTIKLLNISPEQLEKTKNFLDAMYIDLKELF